mgnify:CR=1 FL=1
MNKSSKGQGFFILLIILVGSIGFLQDMDIDNYVETLASGDNSFFNTMNIIFPNVPLLIKTFTEGDLLALLGYILANAVAVVIMLLLSEVLYFRGVIGLTSSGSNRKATDIDKLIGTCKQRNSNAGSGDPAWFLRKGSSYHPR